MSYFSSKSTWLSLVEGQENPVPAADPTLSFEDYRPCFPGMGGHDSEESPSFVAEDTESVRITRELRHRLFFHFKEWEFGPALLEDNLRLAQAQSDPEEALMHYCHARFTAKTLVERWDRKEFLLSWLETDRIIAEVHQLIGHQESCAMYAREGLETIKRNRFEADMDLRITKLAIRFFKLVETRGIGSV